MAKGFGLLAKWDGQQLVPAAHIDQQVLRQMEPGTLLTVSKYRSTQKASAWLHVMLGLAVENSFGWTAEMIKSQVKLRNGWVTGGVVATDGTTHLQLRSTSSFDREELGKFIEQCREFILSEVCPGMDPGLLEREVDDHTKSRR